MRTRWMAVVLLGVVAAGCFSTKGAHSIPKLEGVVVDRETGEPVEGVWIGGAYSVKEYDIMEFFDPGGGSSAGQWCCGASMKTGPDGAFEFPGYWGPEGTGGAVIEFRRKGYMPARLSYRASRKTREVRIRTVKERLSDPDVDVEWRWEGRHVFVRVKLEPVRGTDPEVWERYLRSITRSELLDEAYRYVSQGGELTEGILCALDFWLPAGPPLDGPWRDRRMQVVGEAVLEYCRAHLEGSEFCRRRPFLVENYSKALGLEKGGEKR